MDSPYGTRARDNDALVQVRNLVMHFDARAGLFGRRADPIVAVNGVSFDVQRGETLGLVGESGSGKTTTGRAMLRLIEPSAGTITFDGDDVRSMDRVALRRLRRRAQIIFQDPYGSLNPRIPAGDAILEVLRVHKLAAGRERQRVAELLELVGLAPDHARRYPHEFSGGQRQRIGIARALAVEPDFIVCDEPVSALDVSVQAQVLNLLRSLQQELGLACLFIAHDLAVIRHVSDRVAVMYLGRVVEMGATAAVVTQPSHPYTKALLSAVPAVRTDPSNAAPARIILAGDMPDPARPPTGCTFHPRCPHPLTDEACSRERPELEEKRAGQYAACIKEPPLSGPEVS